MIPDEPTPPQGLPGWVMTFADLMTLLMCFYVLMLSFSEMDIARFKELAGSMKDAFGVQSDVDVRNLPKGTSIIAREFSPGRPDPTPLDEVRQFTINSNLNTLDVGRNERLEEIERRERESHRLAEELRLALAREIAEGKLLIREEDSNVIIQILEQDSFASGQAELDGTFLPVLESIGALIAKLPNAVTVSGHTDNVPIRSSAFRSNWDLSAARAASVVHVLLDNGVAPERLMITGHADTQPRVPNDSPESRAKNRRIDITLVTGKESHASWSPGVADSADAHGDEPAVEPRGATAAELAAEPTEFSSVPTADLPRAPATGLVARP